MADITPPSTGGFATSARSGAPVIGTFVKLAALESVELVARAGFDFAAVDFEHSQLDAGEVGRLVRHCAAIGLPVVVRIPSVEDGLINRLLEAGAAGIQLSSVRRAADAARLRAAMRYSPEGSRSVSTAQPAADYGRVPLGEYLAQIALAPPLVVGQIESATTDDPLDEILVPLDVAFVGTTDLSVDLGVPGDVNHPRVLARIAEVAAAAARAGVVFGGFAATTRGAEQLRAVGARYLIIGSDLQALQHSLAAEASDVRASMHPA